MGGAGQFRYIYRRECNVRYSDRKCNKEGIGGEKQMKINEGQGKEDDGNDN